MTAEFTTLTISGGAATRDLVDAVNYTLRDSGWSPDVPGRRVDQMAGGGPFEDGDEKMLINVMGSTGAVAHANLQALAKDLDQGTRWLRRQNVPALLLNMQPQGSDLGGVLRTPIWGSSPLLSLPASYNDLLMQYEIDGVTLPFGRIGWWLQDDYEVDNPITNSSFELGTAVPTGWSENGSPTVAQSEDNVVQGTYSTRITGTGSPEVGIYINISGLTAAAVYTVSVYVTPTSGGSRLRAYDGGGFTNPVTADSSGTALQRLEVQKTCPGSGSIRVALWVPTGGGVSYFDAVKIEPGTVATAYHPKESEVFTAVASPVASPNIITADFAVSGISSDLPSPIKVELGVPAETALAIDEGFLILVSNDVDEIFQKIPAEDSTATGFTAVTDTTNNADEDDVLRYTPSDADWHESGALISPGPSLTFGWHRLAFFATIRNNDTTKTYRIKVRGKQYPGSADYVETEETILDVGDDDPHPYYLGMLDGFDFYQYLTLVVSASATGGTLDIDTVVVVPLYDEGVHVLKLDAIDSGGLDVDDIVIDSAALTKPEPESYIQITAADQMPIGADGDAFLMMRGLDVRAVWLVCEGANWRETVVTPNALTVTRQLAYLTPE